MKQGIVFVSDLHLFSRRSFAEDYCELIQEATSRSQTCVLGGDIFDFRWTTRRSIMASVDDAIQWLTEMVSHAPDCEFHYILGNHDCHDSFVTRLVDLVDGTMNLTWHPHYLRLGDSLFLHGDVANKTMDTSGLEMMRTRWRRHQKGSAAANCLYDLAVLARLHKLVYRVAYPKRVVARRILKYLQHVEHGPANGVTSVYFGHTHRALVGYIYDGVKFFNCGAPMRGLEFRILEIAKSD